MPPAKETLLDTLLPAGHAALKQASAVLNDGGLVGIPTETVYGLAADATNGAAVASIYAAKGRPQFNPLISHVDGIEMASRFGILDARAEEMVRLFWPGSLTMVVPRQFDSKVNELVTAGLDTIAIRCPDNHFTRSLIEIINRPVAAPSANPSGRLSPTSAVAVREAFTSDVLPLVVDDGHCPMGLESTIVACLPDKPLTILRPGAVTLDDLQAVFGKDEVQVHEADFKDQAKPAAPGMLLSHYAPKAKLTLYQAGRDAPGAGDAVLTFGGGSLSAGGQNSPLGTLDLSPEGDLNEAASNLFSMLRELDALSPETIYVIPPPCTGLGVAIYDRLQRAAAPRINT
ncbi:MAG: L-threonylcarbamoyladenylate synthase [Hyphomicrobiales bacterium]